MKILKNAYYLGETVFWGDGSEPAGTGRIDGIYESVKGELVYRVERLVPLGQRRASLLHEAEIAGRADAAKGRA